MNREGMDRRDFLKTGGAVAAGGMLANLEIFETAASAATKSDRRPNIVFILVDEMRFPSVFPAGVHNAEQFLHHFMPNVHHLWTRGVKFERYYSSGNACSPARATIATGLYPHQEWLLSTRTANGPALQSAFPTYGKLLRSFGYQTPYIGKWHLSNPPTDLSVDGYLADYGFTGLTNPDPTGLNGGGAGGVVPTEKYPAGLPADANGVPIDDSYVANQAVQWLGQNANSDNPFCLTVSFVNPHDRQYFWAGSESQIFTPLFEHTPYKPYVTSYTQVPSEQDPPLHGYPAVPPNWESIADLTKHGKPDTQVLMRTFQELIWGGITDDPKHTGFSTRRSPHGPRRLGVGIAPFSYWQRGLDMYTQVLGMVDEQIGHVLRAIPPKQIGNTVVVFASDHGEYAGAHGFLAGKIGTAYEEAIRLPLIVVDPSRRFATSVDTPRKQLASSVDLTPMLVTLGNRGSDSWRRGKYEKIYGERLDLVKLLRHPKAAGRSHVLFATDEILAPGALNYNHAPIHVLAVRTREAKLVTYSHWAPGTTRPIPGSMKLEFYDYSTANGRAELHSNPRDRRVKPLLHKLLNQYVPTQMEAPLPAPLKHSVAKGRASYIAFEAAIQAAGLQKLIEGSSPQLTELLGYGGPF